MLFEKIAPKKFCFYIELKTACIFIGIVLAIIMAGWVVTSVLHVIGMQECSGCGYNSWKYAYAYSISACIYCCLICLLNLWFIWAVYQEKQSSVLAWVIVSEVWLMQTACLLLVLIFQYKEDVSYTTWIICFVLTILVILGFYVIRMLHQNGETQIRTKINLFVPTKFCFRYELKTGCKYIAVLMGLINVAGIIMTIVQRHGLAKCVGCTYNSKTFAYGYAISACIYSCLMLLTNLWFLWGLKKGKTSVVLAWVVVMSVWLAQSACVLFVLTISHSDQVQLPTAISIILFITVIIVIVLMVYFLLVAYGYWLQLQDEKKDAQASKGPEIK